MSDLNCYYITTLRLKNIIEKENIQINDSLFNIFKKILNKSLLYQRKMSDIVEFQSLNYNDKISLHTIKMKKQGV